MPLLTRLLAFPARSFGSIGNKNEQRCRTQLVEIPGVGKSIAYPRKLFDFRGTSPMVVFFFFFSSFFGGGSWGVPMTIATTEMTSTLYTTGMISTGISRSRILFLPRK